MSTSLVWENYHALRTGYSVQPRVRGTRWASLANGRTIGLFSSELEAKRDCAEHYASTQEQEIEL